MFQMLDYAPYQNAYELENLNIEHHILNLFLTKSALEILLEDHIHYHAQSSKLQILLLANHHNYHNYYLEVKNWCHFVQAEDHDGVVAHGQVLFGHLLTEELSFSVNEVYCGNPLVVLDVDGGPENACKYMDV